MRCAPINPRIRFSAEGKAFYESAPAFRVKTSARQLIVFVLFKVKNCSWRDLQTKKHGVLRRKDAASENREALRVLAGWKGLIT